MPPRIIDAPKRNDHIVNKEAQYDGRDEFVDGQDPDYYNGRSTRV